MNYTHNSATPHPIMDSNSTFTWNGTTNTAVIKILDCTSGTVDVPITRSSGGDQWISDPNATESLVISSFTVNGNQISGTIRRSHPPRDYEEGGIGQDDMGSFAGTKT